MPTKAMSTLSQARSVIAIGLIPVFAIACIVFGGASRENALQIAILQLCATACLAWVCFDASLDDAPEAAHPVVYFWAAFMGVAVIQLVPLPPALWASLPGREVVEVGFQVLGARLPWMPISLTPERTFAVMLQFLPALALFLLAVKVRWRFGLAHMLWLPTLLGVASVLLGTFQVIDGVESSLYLYPTTARGTPVGFFANPNHQACFLLMCLPFAAALAGHLRFRHITGDGSLEKALIAAAAGVSIVIGVIVAGSIAGYILLVPVLLACYPIAMGRGAKGHNPKIVAGAFGTVFLVALLLASSPYVLSAGTSLKGGTMSRPDLWADTLRAIGDHYPLGAGLGSFSMLYPVYENPAIVTGTFANHAHNDYLEFTLEAGIPGCILLGAFLVWWGRRAIEIWSVADTTEVRLRRAATIAMAAVLLHSVADYPARTQAIAAMAALCLALMTGVRRGALPGAESAPPGKNIVL